MEVQIPSFTSDTRQKAFGVFLREHRQVLGWTQEQLAHRVQWTQERISRLENGKYGMPRLPALARLAAGLEMPPSEMLAAAGHGEDEVPSAREIEILSCVRPMIVSETLGDRVRRLRLSRDMSRINLAHAARVSKSHVHQIEMGLRTRMRIATLAKYAHALDVPASYIDYGYKHNWMDARECHGDLITALHQTTRLEGKQIEHVVSFIQGLEAECERASRAKWQQASTKEQQSA